MNLDDAFIKPQQPTLFDYGKYSSGLYELFPQVWQLLEAAINPEISIRRLALKELIELDAARMLPLVAYHLVTRITEPDLDTRALVVYAVSEALIPDEKGNLPTEGVRQCLMGNLSQMRTRQIFALLQVLTKYPNLEPGVARMLNACPYAGNQLADILASRRVPLEIRRYAVRMIGLVGYLDAIPALERLLSRLESRAHGQQAMTFAPPETLEDVELIPDIRRSLAFLKSP